MICGGVSHPGEDPVTFTGNIPCKKLPEIILTHRKTPRGTCPCPRLVAVRKRMNPGSNLALDFSDGAEDRICKLL